MNVCYFSSYSWRCIMNSFLTAVLTVVIRQLKSILMNFWTIVFILLSFYTYTHIISIRLSIYNLNYTQSENVVMFTRYHQWCSSNKRKGYNLPCHLNAPCHWLVNEPFGKTDTVTIDFSLKSEYRETFINAYKTVQYMLTLLTKVTIWNSNAHRQHAEL